MAFHRRTKKIIARTPGELDAMQAAGEIVGAALKAVRAAAAPGVTTLELDQVAEDTIRQAGAYPTFKGYEGFPYSICASVDDQVVHGFASRDKLRKGQLISIDCGVILDGWQSDSAFSVLVGGGSKEAQQLVNVTEECFWLGANMARSGNHLGDISHTVQTHAEAHGYGVIRDLCGHGIGQEMHEDPNVPNYGRPGRGVKLQAGMTIAIEPMISMGTWKVFVDDNDWTICTQDGSLASHYEHTVLITDGEPEILSYPGMEVKKVLEKIR